LTGSFADPDTSTASAPRVHLAKNQVPCPLQIGRVADLRTQPAILGNVAGRTVRAPESVEAWLNNVLGAGLRSRGISPYFDRRPEGVADPLTADVALRTAWVSDLHTSKSSTAVLNLRLMRGDSVVKTQDYRGTDTVMNWASGDGELQRMIDRAFGRALDQIAADVRAACPRS
ncbi:MAG TPA: hypothetical protein VFZ95_06345, partial [Steroidobacteraceae bacterium]